MKCSYFETQGDSCGASDAEGVISCYEMPAIVEAVTRATQSHPLVLVFSSPDRWFFDDSLGPVRYFGFFDMELHEQYNDLLTMKIAKRIDPGQPICFESRGSSVWYRYLAFEMLADDQRSLETAIAFMKQQDISVFNVEHVILVCNARGSFCCNRVKQELEEFGKPGEVDSSILKQAFTDWHGAQKRREGQTALARTVLISDITELSFPDLKILPQLSETGDLQPILPDMQTAQNSYAEEEKRNAYIFDQSCRSEVVDRQTRGFVRQYANYSMNDAAEGFLSFPKDASDILYHSEVVVQYQHFSTFQGCSNTKNGRKALLGAKNADSAEHFSFGETNSGATRAESEPAVAQSKYQIAALPFSAFVYQRYPQMDRSIFYVVRAFHSLFDEPNSQFTVRLHVYKLTKTGILTAFGIGIHHSGWCFGNTVEIGFGYSDAEGTGIYSVQPGGFSEKDLIYKIDYKQIQMSRERFISLLVEACTRFPARAYDLLRFNCNDFSDYMARVMGFGAIPEWINRAARIAQKFTKEKQTGNDNVRKK